MRRFRTDEATKFSWTHDILSQDGLIVQVKCITYSDVSRNAFIMAPKHQTLMKHNVALKYKKSHLLYVAKQPTTVLQQMNRCTTVESKKKHVQFATLFQLLFDGHPMVEYESRQDLYKFLEVSNMPSVYWSYGSGWLTAKHMYDFVKKRIKELINAASFLAMTCDKVSAVDNTSQIVIHLYVMQNWVRTPVMIHLQKLESEGLKAENLTKVLTTALGVHGGLEIATIAQKLVCFGANGVSAFWCQKSSVSKRMRELWSLFMLNVHCFGHKVNLVCKILSELFIFAQAEELMRPVHSYFAHGSKKYV